MFGTYFIAMEYVRGPTLKELVAHCATTRRHGAAADHAQPRRAAVRRARPRAQPRDEHGQPLGIIHRDVSPANLILAGRAALLKLIDFGLAKAERERPSTTAVGVIKGKFGYVAPEYLGGKLDHRADLWAVGIIMYELLTRPPAVRRPRRVRDDDARARAADPAPVARESEASTPELDDDRDDRARARSRAAVAIGGRDARSDRRGDRAARETRSTTRARVEWVNWAFAQTPGRPPQLTPMMPMPITALPIAATSERDDPTDVDPVDAVRLPPYPARARAVPHVVWYAAVVAILLASILYKLVH